MPYIRADVKFEIYCDMCGQHLCNYTRVENDRIYVEACPKCMKEKDKKIEELEIEMEKIREIKDLLKTYNLFKE